MSALIIAAAVIATGAVPAFLVAATGGRTVLYADRDLTQPRTTRRAPEEG